MNKPCPRWALLSPVYTHWWAVLLHWLHLTSLQIPHEILIQVKKKIKLTTHQLQLRMPSSLKNFAGREEGKEFPRKLKQTYKTPLITWKTWKSAWNLNLRVCMASLSLNFCYNQQLWSVPQKHYACLWFHRGVSCWKQNGLWKQAGGSNERLGLSSTELSCPTQPLWERSLCLRERLSDKASHSEAGDPGDDFQQCLLQSFQQEKRSCLQCSGHTLSHY